MNYLSDWFTEWITWLMICRSYIYGMLKNLESLPLDRIYQMLRIFAMQVAFALFFSLSYSFISTKLCLFLLELKRSSGQVWFLASGLVHNLLNSEKDFCDLSNYMNRQNVDVMGRMTFLCDSIVASFWTYCRDHAKICLDLSSCIEILFKIKINIS